MLEQIVYDQPFRRVTQLFVPNSAGLFLAGRASAMSVCRASVWEAFSEGYTTGAIFTDFSAAFFERVNHKLSA